MLRNGLQHHLNALHVMARLVRVGLSRTRALALARWWERVMHPMLYPWLRQLIPVPVTSPEWLAVRPRRRDARPDDERMRLMTTPVAQRMLEFLYRDAGVRQTAKDALTDWILDTQQRTRPLDPSVLVDHLARQHPDLLARLERNVRLRAEPIQQADRFLSCGG